MIKTFNKSSSSHCEDENPGSEDKPFDTFVLHFGY